MGGQLFFPEAFARDVRVATAYRGISQSDVARATGISKATISRIARGKAPDVENYLRLAAWLAENAPPTKGTDDE